MMTASTIAPPIIASGLAAPNRRVNSPGTPKIPPPIVQLIISPVSAHRPTALTSAALHRLCNGLCLRPAIWPFDIQLCHLGSVAHVSSGIHFELDRGQSSDFQSLVSPGPEGLPACRDAPARGYGGTIAHSASVAAPV